MKFLVVEDDRLIRQGLVEILRGEGYDVVDAADGIHGVRMFHEHQPDFVCLDIMLPRASGYEICQQIREANTTFPSSLLRPSRKRSTRCWGSTWELTTLL